MIGLDDVVVCMEFFNVKDTFTYDPHSKQGSTHEITTTSWLLKKSLSELKVSEYHLIFDLNGILVATREGPTRSQPMILQSRWRECLSSCATNFTMYIWYSTTRRKFSKHLEIIRERIDVHIKSLRIVD
jgi:hypothetical protein